MTPEERNRLLDGYRRTRCDMLWHGEWVSVAALPNQPVFLLSAADPGAVPASQEENIQNDARLLRALVAAGLNPIRMRGRGGREPPEEGWLVPHEDARSLALLRQFRQVAGIILDAHGRTVLWADATQIALDGQACRVPDSPPLPASADVQPAGPPATGGADMQSSQRG